jgi:hypothetical protein
MEEGTMNKLQKVSIGALLAIAAVGVAFGSEKKDFAERYKNKYFVVMREGLHLAICSERSGTDIYLQVKVTESGAEMPKQGFLDRFAETDADVRCGGSPVPVHKGEVLRSVKYVRVHGKWLSIPVLSLSPHAITRGVGAFQHESYEHPGATLLFPLERGYDEAAALVDKWLKTFGTQQEAANFGNTASGAFVKEVKLGMTPAEVEAALGLPETKVDLGEKMLYKYKNITVEFHDGKVTDVR